MKLAVPTRMKLPWLLLALPLCALFTSTSSTAASNDQQLQKSVAAYMLAFGKLPDSELPATETRSIAALIEEHRQSLKTNVEALRRTIVKSYVDALGRTPTEAETVEAAKQPAIYAEILAARLKALGGNPAEYQQMLNRAYRFVLRRDIYPTELPYWKNRDTVSFAIVVACLETWARRNQPGLMETSGEATVSVNCAFLSTQRVSQAVAIEAFTALGLPYKIDSEGANPSAFGRNIVTVGAHGAISAGNICFVAVGAPVLTGNN
jgi:hypothetical protein